LTGDYLRRCVAALRQITVGKVPVLIRHEFAGQAETAAIDFWRKIE
jgi:hypothetical protein